jgi:very-short-patch-repair endonuclease
MSAVHSQKHSEVQLTKEDDLIIDSENMVEPHDLKSSIEDQNNFAFDSFEAVRKKLLDLSGRNPLLNYKHPKSRSLRLIDELPNQIAQLLRESKVFALIPIPEPTEKELIDAQYLKIEPRTKEKKLKSYPSAEEWAKFLGFATAYDLPEISNSVDQEKKHQDTNLQTLLYAPDLEARLRGLRDKAQTAIEESGSNILYLTLGFLEWIDSTDSDITRLAPLFTLPVRLDRAKLDRHEGVYRYTVALKDDGLLSNFTLREKLANDFNLVLPEIDDESTPDEYFEQVQNTILRHQPRWRIKRQASLVLLNFAKQAMYLDLNPINWPKEEKIEDHPIIKQFFGTSPSDAANNEIGYASEHSIDHIPEIHDQFPLIYEADSSQHSALIDAVNGENLVIEGPPGSGKSQTITNVIAACIANGQKVLFVAEKMAALDVVKSRLDRAGLGDFCLELHSHKTQKQKILADLSHRLNNQGKYRSPASIEADIAQFESMKERLHDYVKTINSKWKQTGLTLHEIFTKATRYREELGLSPETLKIECAGGDELTLLRQNELFDQADLLTRIFKQVSKQTATGNIAHHFWYGVNDFSLTAYQADALNQHLTEWTEHLNNLSAYWRELELDLNLDSKDTVAIEEIRSVVDTLKQLPELQGGELLGELSKITEQQQVFKALLDDYQLIHQLMDCLSVSIKPTHIRSEKTYETLTQSLQAFSYLGFPRTTKLEEIAKDRLELVHTTERAAEVARHFKQMLPSMPTSLHPAFMASSSGLKEFLSLARLIEQLPTELWRHRDKLYNDPDLDPLLESLTDHLRPLVPLHKELADKIGLSRLPSSFDLKRHQAILESGGVFCWFSSEWRKSNTSILALSQLPKPKRRVMIELLPQLIEYSLGVEAIDLLNKKNPLLKDIYCGVETPLEQISTLRRWYKAVKHEYGASFGHRVAIGNGLIALDGNLVLSIADTVQRELGALVQSVQQSVTEYQQRFAKFESIANPQILLDDSSSPLYLLAEKLDEHLSVLADCVQPENATLQELAEASLKLTGLHKQIIAWERSEIVRSLVGEKHLPLSLIPKECSYNAVLAGKNTLLIAQILSQSPLLLRAILAEPNAARYQALLYCLPKLSLITEAANIAANRFQETGSVKFSEWLESSFGQLTLLIQRNRSALENPNWLNTWLDYVRLKRKLSSDGMSRIIASLEDQNIHPVDLHNVVQLVVHHHLANEILAEHESLALFSGLEQMAIREKFQEYDRNLMELQRQKIAFKASRELPPAGIASGKVSNYTETALIRHNIGLKRNVVAVRTLMRRSGKAIQTLKPCFMMSPMSVAQYLVPGTLKFDLVVMDEASQIRPEDALGAIARGSRLVVVGDPKQLPPTSFFEKIINDDEDSDGVALEESESILDSAIPMFKNRRLRWHYRSRHESLIAFSNQHFYDTDLILFPSPCRESEEFGIRFNRIEKGRFVNSRNVEEAMQVVRNVETQLMLHPEESLGIVAMNSEQRDEIERQLDQVIKDNSQFRIAYELNLNSDEPIFVKNLENVQGDERDVIMISMTYGPEQVHGRTMQRFGPINTDVGWRRLNVLFTRSKKRMHIYSSMGSGDIIVSETSKRGLKALRAFLEYCETGHLHHNKHTGRPAESDFEIAVMRALSAHGYDCEPQLGVAGYFLDLAVKDPREPGLFMMGIECDGATYHSAKSTRDRDRLRQDIMEGLGWRVRRIWSTDWFRNPQAQLQPILAELAQLKSAVPDRKFYGEVNDDWCSSEPLINKSNSEQLEVSEVDRLSVTDVITPPMLPDAIAIVSSLKDRLVKYNNEVIKHDLPMTDDHKRLLRPAMMQALLHKLPCSKAEFLECIPGYLRLGTAPEEGQYLDEVLGLIGEFG